MQSFRIGPVMSRFCAFDFMLGDLPTDKEPSGKCFTILPHHVSGKMMSRHLQFFFQKNTHIHGGNYDGVVKRVVIPINVYKITQDGKD